LGLEVEGEGIGVAQPKHHRVRSTDRSRGSSAHSRIVGGGDLGIWLGAAAVGIWGSGLAAVGIWGSGLVAVEMWLGGGGDLAKTTVAELGRRWRRRRWPATAGAMAGSRDAPQARVCVERAASSARDLEEDATTEQIHHMAALIAACGSREQWRRRGLAAA
jgi:hypothetical protein